MDWTGQTVVIVGSGPSLTQADCDRVEQSRLTTVAVNNAWTRARFCHALYAGDLAWWRHYGPEVDIKVKKFTLSQNAAQVFGIKHHKTKLGSGYNSGVLACEMAIHFGATRLLLLGFDSSVKHGTHFHGDHPKTQNPNKERCYRWAGFCERLAKTHKGVDIINCSRYTVLKTFPLMDLEAALCEHG